MCVCRTHGLTACYLNASIQALFHCRAFVVALRLVKDMPKLTRQLQTLCNDMMTTERAYCDPTELRAVLPDKYHINEHQDAPEFIRYIFEEICEEEKQMESPRLALGETDRKLVGAAFGSVISNKLECRHCNLISEHEEQTTEFKFLIPQADDHHNAVQQGKALPLTIQTLFNAYVHKDLLEGEHQYFCRSCMTKRDADKWVEITSPPQHMMVVLNRFSYKIIQPDSNTEPQFVARKELTPVGVDSTINVGGFYYNLYAVIVHQGASARHGHYFTIGRHSHSDSGTWYMYDDKDATRVENEVNMITNLANTSADATPYVLFYRRAGTAHTTENDEGENDSRTSNKRRLSMSSYSSSHTHAKRRCSTPPDLYLTTDLEDFDFPEGA
eukprot:GHVU01147016.1.p1 GENE.GHVU01147016.1~~GHVU01147016.1.p1  ORF type:complete len:385 (+),score=24.00 GHVU01147016.1:1309-2463(+)